MNTTTNRRGYQPGDPSAAFIMSGMQQGDHGGTSNGTISQRSDFHVFDDLASLHDNENTWAQLFACTQQDGESVYDFGTRVIGLTERLADLDPALKDCLVFHRVKAGLRKPIRDVLYSNTIQPNTHAMLDQVATAIAHKLQPTGSGFALDTLTPRLTPTPNGNNVQGFQVHDNSAPSMQSSSERFATAGRVDEAHQEQPWGHDTSSQRQPPRADVRASQINTSNNPSDGDAFQIRGLHQTRQPTRQAQFQQHSPQDSPGTAHYSPSSTSNELTAPMLGRHEVQHTASPFRNLKRPGSDTGPFESDDNDQSSRGKVIPFAEYQRRKQQGPLECYYCHELGHIKNTCPKNPQKSSRPR